MSDWIRAPKPDEQQRRRDEQQIRQAERISPRAAALGFAADQCRAFEDMDSGGCAGSTSEADQ